ncbi:cupin domain-containing protein [Ferruginibacter paludis]|uniref:cupin domain-containing protein n=1 Tax=Ferruginibacter paludis TaxID=1310417 RepID=UPI0025B3FEB7|nr:cupin domain-containing protein [Ferruginibacter paludis]MDN3655333.1 cupin domain-containing protein [Ferruginibacter paludis]
MEQKFNDATPQRKQDHLLDAVLVSINIAAFTDQLKQEQPWKESDRNSITVFKTDGMRIVLIGLHAGAEMAKHTAGGYISVQVLEGQIKFTTDDKSLELSKGQMLALHPGIPHSVLAVQETIFLLTLATTMAGKE